MLELYVAPPRPNKQRRAGGAPSPLARVGLAPVRRNVEEALMAGIKRLRRSMPPEVKAAYANVESGVKSLGKSIAEIQKGLRRAERQIEADARGRIRALRQDAREQLAGLQTKRREATQTLGRIASAAEGSWQDLKQSADAVLAEGRTMASSVIDRFRNAIGPRQ
jgi:hypothetical protein